MSSGRPDGFEHEVLVGHRDHGNGHAGERAELAREHAARVDDDLGLDLATVGLDRGDAAALRPDRRDARAGVHFGAAPPRALGEGERELARVDVPVGREIRGTEDAVGRHRREEILGLGGRDELEREAERLRPSRLARDLLHPLLRRREPEGAHLAPTGLEPDLGLERPVEVDALHHHLRQRERRAELADQARRVERRAAREVCPLDQDDVVPAEPREPVQDRASPDPAADHHCSRPVPHRMSSVSPRLVAGT